MNKLLRVLLFLGIIVLGASLRLYGLNWDQGYMLQPDERAIIMKVTDSEFRFPQNKQELMTLLTPKSPLNPRWFPYGSFPLYFLKIAGNVSSIFNPQYSQYGRIHLVGRSLSAIFDIGTSFLVFLILYHLTRRPTPSLLGTFLYATAVLPIQLSHFYAVDVPLTFFITLTLYACLRYHTSHSLRDALFIGFSLGLSFATKVSSLLLVVPVVLSFLSSFRHKKMFPQFIGCLAISVLTFAVTMPYAIIDFSNFYQQVREQQAMTRDPFVFPYTLQFVGNIPYIYQIKNIFLWGLGPVLSIPAFLGVLLFTVNTIRNGRRDLLILFVFFWLFLGIVGGFAVGFIRYLLPLYPLFVIFAALLLVKLRPIYLVIILCLNLVWPLSFMHIYSVPNTRITATQWVIDHFPSGATLAREHWDDGLPLRNGESYRQFELPLYDSDTNEKWTKIDEILALTDYIIIASNRLYTPLMKLTNCENLPEGRCYPMTAKYYSDLFSGQRGFRKVATFRVLPEIPILHLPIQDISADESFTVYDHPTIFIFQKDGL